MGASGSGKTTIARLLPRFWDVQEGRISIGGVDVRDISKESLMDSIAFVFQQAHLLKRPYGKISFTANQMLQKKK